MLIRTEGPWDVAAIDRVHSAAFRRGDDLSEPVEVLLVHQLRRSDAWLPHLSLVAEIGARLVGHVVCSRAQVGLHPVLGLGPLGVHPDAQGRGVGTALMHEVLAAADARDEALVALLGEPAYYQRFGFAPADELGVRAPDPAWGRYFQARPLRAYHDGLRGEFSYAAPYRDL